MTLRFALAAALAALSLGAPPARALTPVNVASGLTAPLFLTAPPGDPRLFVVEKGGAIKVIQGGAGVPWFDLSAKVDSTGERGLLGLAFDPGFASNGRFYVNYIDKTTKNTVVARYTVPVPASGVPDPASAQTIITIVQPSPTNHKAGWIGFRPTDPGNLYIATGDGGSSNDPGNVAQNKSNDLGKILRVTPGANGGYTVPAGNPFVGVSGNDEIWSFGLRNPFRSSFDRQTGDFWIADVGQGLREEVNFESAATPGGRNYGWRAREGTIDNPSVPDAAPPGAVGPLFDYPHTAGNASIIGGYVYRGGADASIDGLYFYGDFVSGRIWSGRLQGGAFVDVMERADLRLFGGNLLTSFGEDRFGGLYVMGLDGNVYRIAAGVPEPSALALMAAGLLALIALGRSRRGL